MTRPPRPAAVPHVPELTLEALARRAGMPTYVEFAAAFECLDESLTPRIAQALNITPGLTATPSLTLYRRFLQTELTRLRGELAKADDDLIAEACRELVERRSWRQRLFKEIP